MVLVGTAGWVSNQYPKSATRPMRAIDGQIVTHEGQIDRHVLHMVSYDKVRDSSMPFYAPSSISCDDFETRFWSGVRWGRGRAQSQCDAVESGSDWSGTLFLIPMSGIVCRRSVGALFHRWRSQYLKQVRKIKTIWILVTCMNRTRSVAVNIK